MSEDIGEALARLSRAPVPAALVSVDATVMARVAELPRRLREVPPGVFVLAVAVALLMGLAGGVLPDGPANAEEPLSPIDSATRLAPSTLLGG